MERPKHTLRLLGVTALVGASVFFGLKPQDHIMSADDWFQREQVLSSYPFTYDAVRYLDQVPFFNRQTTDNGGGYYKNEFPYPPYIEVFDRERTGFTSDEAALHEMGHSFFDYISHKDPTFADRFTDAYLDVADHDIHYGYFWTLNHGHPGTNWHGIDHSNTTELYASISSWSMGGTRNPIPTELVPFYSYEFDLANQTSFFTDVRYKNFEPNVLWSEPQSPTK